MLSSVIGGEEVAKNKFGIILRQLRIARGLSERQLALRVGVSISYISKIENGAFPAPSANVISKIASTLKADVNELLNLAGKLPYEIYLKARERAILEFGPKLKELRNKSGLSQLEFARQVFVDPSYICKLENMKMPPPNRRVLLRMAKALRVSKNELIATAGKAPSVTAEKQEVGQMFRDVYRSIKRNLSVPNLSPLTNKGWVRVAISVLLVVSIAGGLYLASPSTVEAVTISFPSIPAGTQGSSHTFTVRVDITGATDLLPVQSVDIWVEDLTGANSFTLTGVPLTATTTTFSPSGVGTVSVTATPDSNWAWATSGGASHYGYGYGYTSGTWGTETYGYGYGYGYIGGVTGDTYIVFTVTWTPPASWSTGTYNTNAIVYGNGASTAFTSQTPGSFTISAAAAAPSAPPEGPGLPPISTPLVTDVGSIIDPSGEFTEPLTIESRDGEVSIDIAAGTVGLDEDGRPLSEITITRGEDPPASPAGTDMIGVPYNFGPDGATFNPPVTITFKFSSSQLPLGTDAEDLSIYYFNPGGEWVELAASDITIDPDTGTITARVSHFTYFSAIVHSAPATFKASNLVISPSEADIAEEILISATFTNTGDIIGSYDATLKINGKSTSVKRISLDGDDSTKVQFVTVQGKAGSYTVAVDGLSGKFTVKAMPTAPIVIAPSVPQVFAPVVEYPTPTAPAPPAVPVPVPAPTPWLAIIIALVVTSIVAGILVWNYGFRRE